MCPHSLSATVGSIEEGKPFTIPEVREWVPKVGTTLFSGKVRSNKAAAKTIAYSQLLSDIDLMKKDHKDYFSLSSGAVAHLVLDARSGMAEEEYEIAIGTNITLKASSPRGLFWATQTLLQLLETTGGKLPQGVIKDAPKYKLRGFMLDCGRKFFPMSYLRGLVREMAYYKMNTLQIHLNDNGFKDYFDNDWDKTQSAFRMQSDFFPGLTARDGSYGKDEFRELQKYAMSLGVEIIPEIDVPAHSLAFTHYRPEIKSKDYGDDHLDLFNPSTYTFLDSLFAEYCAGPNPVFVGPKVCIGTDEYSNARREVVEKFRAFTDHYIREVEKYGKQATLWGSLTHAKGSTPIKVEGVLMNLWSNGYARPMEMKELGYQLVSIPDGYVYIVPNAGYYYDYLNHEALYKDWTPNVVGNVTLDVDDPQLEGGMFAVWNDHFGNGVTVQDVHHRIFPALQTLSTKMWTAHGTTVSYETFNTQRLMLSEAPGLNILARFDDFKKDVVLPNQTMSIQEVGFDYSVSFSVLCTPEAKGTVLFKSPNAVVYLSDPEQGKLAFEREGYISRFNYRLPESGTVNLTIEGTNKETRLLVDGKHKETLKNIPLFATKPASIFNRQVGEGHVFKTEVFSQQARMYFLQTLFFPLAQTGNFKSQITNLEVSHLEK